MSDETRNTTENTQAPVETTSAPEVRESRGGREDRREGGMEGGDKKKFYYTKKVCKFCTRQIEEKSVIYKNVDLLRRFVMPSGKILPRRISGNCAKHQRRIVEEIKKARIMAFLPFLDR